MYYLKENQSVKLQKAVGPFQMQVNFTVILLQVNLTIAVFLFCFELADKNLSDCKVLMK